MRIGAAALAAVAVASTAGSAFAQGGVSTSTRASTTRAEAGSAFTVSFTVLSNSGSALPTMPRLPGPAGFSVHGPSVSTQQQVSISGNQVVQKTGITATWTLSTKKLGTHTIGPPSARVGSTVVTGDPVRVEIVKPGSLPRSPGGLGNPFGPFRSFPGLRLPPLLGTDDEEDDPTAYLPPYPGELRIDGPLDGVAFLRPVVDKPRVVVGEQITFKVYAYGGRGPFREVNTAEPSRADFLAFQIQENSYGQQQHRVPVGDEVWYATTIREMALFPIKSGTLSIGPMRMGFSGRGYPSDGKHKGLVRESAAVQVAVSLPPTSGRPARYQIGDVGQYTLTATVEPRLVTRGESVSVVAKLEGTGNLPHKLNIPTQHGVAWLEPTITEKVSPRGSTMGGWRRFSYIVRINKAGQVDLGEIELPYWNPDRESYRTAQATLGFIEAKPRAAGAEDEDEDDENDPLAALRSPRSTLGPEPRRPLQWAEHPWFWGVLAFGPVGVLGIGGTLRLGRSLRERWRQRRESHQTRAARALREARAAMGGDEPRTAPSAIERAVFIAVEGAIGLKARALLKDELVAKLESRGLESDVAEEVAAILDACEAARFGGDTEGSLSELLERAQLLLKRLGRLGQT